jgi:hypothetical protein
MALIHQATLTPPKLELLSAWLPTRPWADDTGGVTQLGTYRFDDPAGQVGVETFLVREDDGDVLHVPLTYRSAPMLGADEHLVGTTEHSVLGTRWVYDGCADPVYALTLATAILTGGSSVEELVDRGDRLEPRTPTATAQGSGTAGAPVPDIGTATCEDTGPITLIRTGSLTLAVARVIGATLPGTQTLTARWANDASAIVAALAR